MPLPDLLLPCFGSLDPYPRIVSGVYDAEITVSLGTPSIFSIPLIALAGRGGSLTVEAGSGLSDFGGGGDVQWPGFDELTQGGTPIPFTMTSQSGTDWTQPISEPSATLAGLAAALSLTLQLRHSERAARRRTRRPLPP